MSGPRRPELTGALAERVSQPQALRAARHLRRRRLPDGDDRPARPVRRRDPLGLHGASPPGPRRGRGRRAGAGPAGAWPTAPRDRSACASRLPASETSSRRPGALGVTSGSPPGRGSHAASGISRVPPPRRSTSKEGATLPARREPPQHDEAPPVERVARIADHDPSPGTGTLSPTGGDIPVGLRWRASIGAVRTGAHRPRGWGEVGGGCGPERSRLLCLVGFARCDLVGSGVSDAQPSDPAELRATIAALEVENARMTEENARLAATLRAHDLLIEALQARIGLRSSGSASGRARRRSSARSSSSSWRSRTCRSPRPKARRPSPGAPTPPPRRRPRSPRRRPSRAGGRAWQKVPPASGASSAPARPARTAAATCGSWASTSASPPD